MFGRAGLYVRTNGILSSLRVLRVFCLLRAWERGVWVALSIAALMTLRGKPRERSLEDRSLSLSSRVSGSVQMRTKRKARLYGILFLVCKG